MTYEAIARTIAQEFKLKFYSRARAFEDVQFALQELNREFRLEAEELRRLEAEKLDRLESALFPSALHGNPKAVDAIRGLMERRSRLLGLDATFVDRAEQEVLRELTETLTKLQALMSRDAYLQLIECISKLQEQA